MEWTQIATQIQDRPDLPASGIAALLEALDVARKQLGGPTYHMNQLILVSANRKYTHVVSIPGGYPMSATSRQPPQPWTLSDTVVYAVVGILAGVVAVAGMSIIRGRVAN
jgi:hypothetical protein